MSKTFDYSIENLSRKSGYSYDFLVDVYNTIAEDSGVVDWKYFAGVSMEHDW